MSVERTLLISLLKLTQTRAVEQEKVNIDARIPAPNASILLRNLQRENLICLKSNLVEIDSLSRLKIAVKAMQLGADLQHISDHLSWQEFEAMAATAMELNGYESKKNVRFKNGGRRREIDVIGIKKPLVLCIDCKHWRRGMHPSVMKKIASAQAERVATFADYVTSSGLDFYAQWDRAEFVPVILSLIPYCSKFYEDIPIVPILKLQDFVSQLVLNMDLVRRYCRKFSHL